MTALLTEGCLKNHPFLNDCSTEFLNHLEEFSTEVSFESGQMILKEGGYADKFYLICEGKVQLEMDVNRGAPISLQMLGPGDVLGWSWIYPPFEWHFSARAIEPCKAVELNAASLLIRAEEEPAFGYQLMKRISMHLVQRLQMTRKRLQSEIACRERSELLK